jgi:hypothetical protein
MFHECFIDFCNADYKIDKLISCVFPFEADKSVKMIMKSYNLDLERSRYTLGSLFKG